MIIYKKILLQIHHFIFFAIFLILGIWSISVTNFLQFFIIIFFINFFYITKIYFQFNPNKLKIFTLIFLAIFSFLSGAYRTSKINLENQKTLELIQEKQINGIGLIQEIDFNEENNLKTIKLKIIRGYIDKQYEEKLCDKILCLYCNKFSNLKIGQIIKFKDFKISSSKNAEFNLYCAKEKILATIFTDKNKLKVIGYDYSFESYLFNLRDRVFRKLKSKINTETFSYFSSIFLGHKIKNKDYDNLKDKFNFWGISHYLARSGLHVLIILILLQFIFKFFPVGLIVKQILSISLIGIYTTLTWSSISFIRSIIMFFLCQICMFVYLQIQTLHIVTLTTIFVLLNNPLQLFFLDFQLSFALTFFLALFFDINNKKSIA
ncbi:ComEC/Rec2 family competence protein [Candidatus Dependentiae bacterium]|nr:ComEC/Rec2 family competence protein [Candidatus Dependentiae bacterium]